MRPTSEGDLLPPADHDYYLVSPVFRRTRLRLPGRRPLVISAPGTSPTQRHVQRASFNGKRLRTAWIGHRRLMRGGRLVLRMRATPSSFGTGRRPPSVTR